MAKDLEPRLEREAADLGLSMTLLRTTKHKMFCIAAADGRARMMTVPISPRGSGYRALRNIRAAMRRFAKGE